ncbi:MAG TPA: divergent polysaccharide deacetylase family protein [Thermoanaerobaculia bacterium]|nr:divergent polysaccharide deacetylase family protein [Thermoanaerobaculia bacterium]
MPSGRWLVLALAGAALFAAGLYLGRGGGQEAPEAAEGAPAGQASGDAPPRRAAPPSEEPAPPPVPTEPEHPVPAGETEPPPVEGPPPPGDGAAVSLVIDDLGRSVADLDRLAALGVPVTYAVLPFESLTAEVAGVLRERRAEVILHLPMEPSNGADPGPGALTRAMGGAELGRATRRALRAVPGAVGVNNHMGSGLSADRASMEAVLRVIGERGLYFLDSRTSAESVAFATARELDIPAAERQVFLDPDPRPEAVRHQFRRLLEAARERGAAIAIGHPHPHTLEVLEEEVPLAVERGYRFVPVSYLLERSSVAAR